jgi:hypothetical protein
MLPPGKQITLSPAPVLRMFKSILKNYSDSDYILTMGDPVAIAIASIVASDVNNGVVNILKWDRENRAYYNVMLDYFGRKEKRKMSKETWIFDEVEKHQEKKKLRTDSGLEIVTAIGNKLLDKKRKLEEEEERLKSLKAEILEIEQKELPDAMTACGNLKSFTLKDGSEIKIKDDIFCSIPADKKAGAFKWLEENGHSELIKHDVKVSFPKGKYDQADELISVLTKNFKDIPYEEKTDVHAQTLKAFAKDQYKLGQTLPEEYFSVYEASIAKIKLGKEK